MGGRQMLATVFKNEVLRYPRLDTVLMIEEAARKGREGKTVAELWKGLPRKVMWQTFVTALDYLEYSGKLVVEKDRTVTWIWNPKLLERVKREGVEA